MSDLGEMLAQRREQVEGDSLTQALENLNSSVAAASFMMIVDKSVLEVMNNETKLNNELIVKAVETMQGAEVNAVTKKLADQVQVGLKTLASTVKEQNAKDEIMALSESMTALINTIRTGQSAQTKVLEDMAIAMDAQTSIVKAQTDLLQELLTTMRTPKTLVCDDDGNPVGVKLEYDSTA